MPLVGAFSRDVQMAAQSSSAKSATVFMTAFVSVRFPAQFTSTPTSFVASHFPPEGVIHVFVTTSAAAVYTTPSKAKPTVIFRILVSPRKAGADTVSPKQPILYPPPVWIVN